MGLKGKEVAIENSDAVFVKDEIGEVPYLLSMAKRTLRKLPAHSKFAEHPGIAPALQDIALRIEVRLILSKMFHYVIFTDI